MINLIIFTNKDKVTIHMEKGELDTYLQSLQRLYLDAVDHRVTKARIQQKDYKILDFLEFEEHVK